MDQEINITNELLFAESKQARARIRLTSDDPLPYKIGPVEQAYRERRIEDIERVVNSTTIDTQALAFICELLLTWETAGVDVEDFRDVFNDLCPQ